MTPRILIALLLSVAASSAADRTIDRIEAQPAQLEFSNATGRKAVILGHASDGSVIDLTDTAEYQTPAIVERSDDGVFIPIEAGSGVIRISAAGQSVELPVDIAALDSQAKPNFIRDVMPILNKAGCTSGPCHGSAKGKNGFKLSLRGYDPDFDYRALLFDISGRRFNRAAPAESLMLAKPTQQAPHEGGLRFEKDSRYYQTIFDWISEGVPFGDPEKDSVASLEVFPAGEMSMPEPGLERRLVVLAHYADGSMRDVSREAVIESNETSVAGVAGDLVTGKRIGEATLMVRYEGKFVTVPVTVLNPKPGFEFHQLTQLNYIDEHIDAKLAKLKIQPSPLADEASFLRRVYLDLTGAPPTLEQAHAFLDDPERSQIKRRKLIDQLIGSPGFVDHWTLKWGDLLQSNRDHLGEKGLWAFRQWIRDAIQENTPYDKFVREMLTSVGSTYDQPAANFFRVNDNPKVAMENTTQLFLGVRMVCAQCHDHPFERWTQNQYYQLSAFFAAVGMRPGFDSDEQIVYLKREKARMKHPKDGREIAPEYLLATAGAPPIGSLTDRRAELAAWLTSEKNPYFAKAIVNRLWSYFFHRGIIEPVDDIRASNPPVNAALLDALEKDFIEHGFDMRHIIRRIVSSRTYQASIETNEWNAGDETNFSHFIPRRLPAESLLDALTIATGSRPEFEDLPEGFTAQQLPDPHAGMDSAGSATFLDMFGRPERESSCECERRGDVSLPQAMNLINGPTMGQAIADPEGRIAKALLAGASDRELIDELYLAALSRKPTAEERDKALTYLGAKRGRARQAQDLLWALVNSNAFLFNR
ncbi:MAG: DUF1549 and DUF1553 domain-containing protein [Bryobacterales bacterium]